MIIYSCILRHVYSSTVQELWSCTHVSPPSQHGAAPAFVCAHFSTGRSGHLHGRWGNGVGLSSWMGHLGQSSKVRPFCCVGFLGDRWLHVGACVARPCVRAALRPFDWRLSKRTAGCTTPRVTRTLRAACCGTPRLGRARLADGGVRGGVRWDLLGVRAEAGQGRRGRFVFWLRVPPGARTMRSATLSLPAGARRTPKAAGHLGQPSVGVRLSPGEPGVQSADCV